MKNLNPFKVKTKQGKLEYLNRLQYDIVLKQKNGMFYLIIPELAIVAADENLEKAYKELYEQKHTYFNKMLDCDAEDEIALPRKGADSKDTLHQLKIFVYKASIVCLLLGVVMVSAGTAIVNKMYNVSAGDIVKNAVKSAVLTVTNAPESAKKARIEKLRQFLKDFRPVAEEVRSLFLIPEKERSDEDAANADSVAGEGAKR